MTTTQAAEAGGLARFRVEGMDCAGCAAKIDTAVRRMPGVSDVSVSVTRGTMTIRHDHTSDLDAIAGKVRGLGYPMSPLREASTADVADLPGVVPPGCGHDHGDHAHNGDQTHHGDEARHGNGNGNGDGHAQAHDDRHHRAASATGDGSHGHDQGPADGRWWQSRKGRLTIACGAALAAAYAVGHVVPSVAALSFVVAMLVGLIPIARRAVMAALAGTPFSIEMLMTIAAVGAIFIDAGEEAAAVVFLFLVGELLEGVAAGRARASIKALSDLVPKTALLEEDGRTRAVPAERLAVGAVILVRPGDRIPADGVILSGEGVIDESPVTGESTPVNKGVDAAVFAGTVNNLAALRIRVTATASDNTIARVIRLVEEAQDAKSPTERFIDRFSKYYTPGVVAVAALVAVLPPLLLGGIWSEWIYKGLAVLLIGCPCALVISTPAAIAASLSAGARRGLLLKGGAVLETIGRVTAVAFDKTGTLTAGKPVVTDIIAFERSEADVLIHAAALEAGSNHPLARAVLAKAAQAACDIPQATDAKALGGEGVTATVGNVAVFFGSPKAAGRRAPLSDEQAARIAALHDEGKTVSVLVVGGMLAGAIAMRDEPRADARAGLKALTDAGMKIVMLTGDNIRTATAVGQTLGIDVRADLMPQDKLRIVGELKAQGYIVAKVGDGINDAPALAAADIGIAMGGGTDVALETADAAALNGRVADVAAMIDLSKRTMANIRQNIALSLGLKAVFLVTTVIGVTGLWPAILADTGATVLVTLNALRLLRPVPVS